MAYGLVQPSSETRISQEREKSEKGEKGREMSLKTEPVATIWEETN